MEPYKRQDQLLFDANIGMFITGQLSFRVKRILVAEAGSLGQPHVIIGEKLRAAGN
jgi:hypothetical protein